MAARHRPQIKKRPAAEVMKYYSLLDQLSDKTAQKICHDNILNVVKRYK